MIEREAVRVRLAINRLANAHDRLREMIGEYTLDNWDVEERRQDAIERTDQAIVNAMRHLESALRVKERIEEAQYLNLGGTND